MSSNKFYQVGDATIVKLEELSLSAAPYEVLYPEADPAQFKRSGPKVDPLSNNPVSGNPTLSLHTWLVKTPRHTILVDTASGNGKTRPFAPHFENLNEPYLERLKTLGVAPEDVSHVLLTHLHVDHVGWNTRLHRDQWIPTFPNAKYVFSEVERQYNEALADDTEPTGNARPEGKLGPSVGRPYPLVYNDSVRPVIERGQALMVHSGVEEVIDGISFLPTPGHSVDHASIRLLSRGQEAFFWGDVLHHPLQIHETDLNSCYCEFPAAALKSRRWALEHASESNATVFTTHFPRSSAGRVYRRGSDFSWEFL